MCVDVELFRLLNDTVESIFSLEFLKITYIFSQTSELRNKISMRGNVLVQSIVRHKTYCSKTWLNNNTLVYFKFILAFI